MMQGRRGRGRAVANQRRTQARVNDLSHQLKGTKYNPTPFPRPFTAVPWNSLTVDFENKVETGENQLELTVTAILTRINEKVGSDAKFKVIKAEVWCTASGLSYPTLKTEFYDLSYTANPAGDSEARSQQADRGTLNAPAKTGFMWPMTDQKQVLTNPEAQYKVLYARTGAEANSGVGTVLYARVHLLWKYTAASF
jgi:hypothetical protein